ncbi:hypothetical protein [Williamsia sp.]|uniref:hypothetical protein n=1 Tax=Williamsia sp. TaxID=1872085 RepID=UPI002F9227FC
MTVYSTDLNQLITTIRNTLVHKVVPGVTDDDARRELASVLEQLDNLAERVGWDHGRLADACTRSDELAARIGFPNGPDTAVDVDRLRARRREIATALRGVYSGSDPARMVEAVTEFTDADVTEQISTILRAGLAD